MKFPTMIKKEKLWNSYYHRPTKDIPDEKWFYDKSEIDWVPIIENNWEIIRDEINRYIQKDKELLQPYFEKAIYNPNWKNLTFFFWKDFVYEDNCNACPETIKILKSIPNVVTAAVNILEPHGKVPPHRGNTNAIYRCHLGLSIPGTLPDTGFHLGKESRGWEEGKLLVFNDFAYHTAWNNCDSPRSILMIDVVRPEFAYKKNWICKGVFASFYLFKMEETNGFLRKLPLFVKRLVHFPVTLIFYLFPSFLIKKAKEFKIKEYKKR